MATKKLCEKVLINPGQLEVEQVELVRLDWCL